MAARAKRKEISYARWLAAMPKSLRPLWARATRDELSPNIKPLRVALAKEFPNIGPRVLALFTWFGSGDGPWSGHPSYESIAEELLLDFSTPDLVAAAQTDNLTEEQIEGAARLFGGWDFSQRRPDDRNTLPTLLKKKLLEHSSRAPITTNWEAPEALSHDRPSSPPEQLGQFAHPPRLRGSGAAEGQSCS